MSECLEPRALVAVSQALLQVGAGRGFVVERRVRRHTDRIVITAAHCIAHARLADGEEGLPPCHPGRFLVEQTYRDLIGPLGGAQTVWAACLFVDPIADIAVLGQPDSQELIKHSEAYDALVESMTALPVADAPTQGVELVTLDSGYPFESPTPGEGPAWALSLNGRWEEGQVARRGGWLAFKPGYLFVGGMSGSPIINMDGAAFGIVSVSQMSPVILDSLSAQLARSIIATRPAL